MFHIALPVCACVDLVSLFFAGATLVLGFPWGLLLSDIYDGC